MKRITYLAASAVLAVSMLASCGGNKNANNAEQTATENAAAQDDSAKAAAYKAAAE